MLRWIFGPRQADPVVTEALASQRELITVLAEKLAEETSRADKAEAESAARLEDLRKLNLALRTPPPVAPSPTGQPGLGHPIGASALIDEIDAVEGRTRERLTQDDRPPAFANTSVGGGHFYRPRKEDDRRPVPDTVAQA